MGTVSTPDSNSLLLVACFPFPIAEQKLAKFRTRELSSLWVFENLLEDPSVYFSGAEKVRKEGLVVW